MLCCVDGSLAFPVSLFLGSCVSASVPALPSLPRLYSVLSSVSSDLHLSNLLLFEEVLFISQMVTFQSLFLDWVFSPQVLLH